MLSVNCFIIIIIITHFIGSGYGVCENIKKNTTMNQQMLMELFFQTDKNSQHESIR